MRAKTAIGGNNQRTLLGTFRGVGKQVWALLLIISVGASPLGRANAVSTSILTPLRTTFTPLGSALELPPESFVSSCQKTWTVNKRFILFARRWTLAFLPDALHREWPILRPALRSCIRNTGFGRSPPV
ncbi:MAG: hypothetical protein JO071_10315 [Deltaproteobacteria bacterium]|nr:hypothetical protein [Deltaproteobacteria bacterium]